MFPELWGGGARRSLGAVSDRLGPRAVGETFPWSCGCRAVGEPDIPSELWMTVGVGGARARANSEHEWNDHLQDCWVCSLSVLTEMAFWRCAQ